jgi:uncharacterized protein (DUF305 family)
MEGPGLVESLKPKGTVQWVVAVVALAFLAGAVGYAVRAFAEPNPNELSATDEGFLRDMIDHHDQAVEMSLIALGEAEDPTVRAFAQEIILQQRWELGVMEAVLGRAGAERGTDPERPAMEWMGMAPMPASSMPGMATPEELDALRAAPAGAVDILFLELMTAHHVAGAEMGEYEAANGSNSYVRQFAEDIARNQMAEIAEYELVLERLASADAA